MTIISVARQGLKKCDLFSSTQFLRFKSDAQTKTLTGGVISLSIMVFLLVTFTTMILDTFKKVIIHSVVDSSQLAQPPAIYYSTHDNGKKFMLGLELWLNNITTGPRMFDIILQNTVYEQAVQSPATQIIPFQRCTIDHWRGLDNIQREYDKLEMHAWLCIPLNKTITVSGKYSSDIQRSMDIIVKACQNDTNPEWPCAPQQQIDTFLSQNGQLYWTIFFMNPLLNPQTSDYLKYYLQDKYYIISGKTYGAEMYIYNSDFQITTDQSIFPFIADHYQTGPIVDSSFSTTYLLENYTDWYVFINFFRSPSTIVIQRTHQKILDALAYVGGLLGSFLLVLVVVNFYNEGSYELNFASALYQPQQGSPTTFRKYNLLFYIIQGIYTLFRMINVKLDWKSTQFYYETRKEMLKQLDVMFLFRRIHILQTGMKYMMKRSQLRGLMLHHQLNVTEARKIRKLYGLKKDVASLVKDKLERIGQNQSQDDKGQSLSHIGGAAQLDDTCCKKKAMNEVIEMESGQEHQLRKKKKLRAADINLEDYGSDSESSNQDIIEHQKKQAELLNDLRELKEDAIHDGTSEKIFASIDPRIKELLECSTDIQFNGLQSKSSQIVNIIHEEDNHEQKTSQTSALKRIKVGSAMRRKRSLIGQIEEEKEPSQKEEFQFDFNNT